MRAALVLLVLLVQGFAADWRNTLTVKPGKMPPPRSLTAEYEFGWSGVRAAVANAKFTHTKKLFRLDLTSHTVGVSRALWRMDTSATSTVNARSLKPVRLVQDEKYSDGSLHTTVDYTPTGPSRLKVATPPDPEPPKVKRFKFGEVHDLHSALLFIRSQRLQPGDTVRLCVYPSSSPYLAEISVAAREKLKAGGKTWNAIRCDLKLREVDKDLKLVAHDKFQRAIVWLSDDADRMLLRIETEVFIGKVWAELKSVEFARKK